MILDWKIGCFTRPYQPYGLQRALEGISAAGFNYVGLMGGGIFAPSVTEQQLKEMDSMFQNYHVKPLAAWAEFRGFDEEGTSQFKKIIDNSVALGFDRILIAGPWPYLEGITVRKPTSRWMREIEEFLNWIKLVSPYAKDRGVKIAIKPHAGITATAKECLETMERINSETVRIWYDPGNIIYYEGLRPQDVPDDLKVIVDYVDGICLKDIVGGRGGDLRAPGQGTINFKDIFTVLREARFKGACILELGVPSGTPAEQVDSILRKSRQYLKDMLSEF